jgi:S-methylmethionine-dependent homocysteine/selenocysteine methylase
MTKYRNNLPQLSGDLFITDGGLETTLIFHGGWELPEFASFVLLQHEAGYAALQQYFQTYCNLAKNYGVGLILESATWRANPEWGSKLGYNAAELAQIDRRAITLLQDLRPAWETERSRIVISGCIGPRGDGYIPNTAMTVEEAAEYHRPQIDVFRDTEADLVTAMTMNYVEEAIGIVRSAQAASMPVVIAFTVETDGKLPTGQSLQAAIAQVDAATDNAPIYYMVNCAHPTHFADVLTTDAAWIGRIRGIRANASSRSHAELNEAPDLDEGNPTELGQQYRDLRSKFPNLNVLGGCCGTDDRHVEAICKACLPAAWAYYGNRLHV